MTLLPALLYLASDGGKRTLAQPTECFYGEIVLAIAEYLTGKEAAASTFALHRPGEYLESYRASDEIVRKIIADPANKLVPALRTQLVRTLTSHFQTDHGERWFENAAEQYYQGLACRPTLHSTFSLSVQLVEQLKGVCSAEIDVIAAAQLNDIARLMQKYIDRDIRHIRKNYCW